MPRSTRTELQLCGREASWTQRMARNREGHGHPQEQGDEWGGKRRGPVLLFRPCPTPALHLADETYDLAPEPGGVESTQVMPIQCHHASCGVIEALQQGSDCGLSWRGEVEGELWGEGVLWRISQQSEILVTTEVLHSHVGTGTAEGLLLALLQVATKE